MITGIFGVISSAVTEFVTALSSVFEDVGGLFYTYDTATSAFNLTFLGTVAIIAVGAGLVWLVYRLLKGAIRGIGR